MISPERYAEICELLPLLDQAELDALTWLFEHNADGLFDDNGVLLAAGELAEVDRRTWNALATIGLIEFYTVTGRGRGRVCITGCRGGTVNPPMKIIFRESRNGEA